MENALTMIYFAVLLNLMQSVSLKTKPTQKLEGRPLVYEEVDSNLVKRNWFMLSASISSYECTGKV